MIHIVIPMAGLGSRFVKAGFKKPKPFIDVCGKPMIERVLENLSVPNSKFILIARAEHLEEYPDSVKRIKDKFNVDFFSVSSITQGTACTVLLARELINNSIPMVIANSDQIIDISFKDFIEDAFDRELDGSILTFDDPSKDPKWSFAKINANGFVEQVKEKEPISSNATVGIYYFKQGDYFVDGAIDMILNQDTVNDEYYTCPVYNYLIKKDLSIGIYNIKKEEMHGIGTPEDLALFSKKISNEANTF